MAGTPRKKKQAEPKKPTSETCGKCGTVNKLGRVVCRKCEHTFCYCNSCKKRLPNFDGSKRIKRCNDCAAEGLGDEPPESPGAFFTNFPDETENLRRFSFHYVDSGRIDDG